MNLTLDLSATKEARQRIQSGPLPVVIQLLYTVERAAAALCLILLAPLLAILTLAIALASGAAPFVAHRRVGRYGETLWVYKFRTMWPCNAAAGRFGLVEKVSETPQLKRGPDPRVTSRLASFCRRHSIDELPQLALVAAGLMSIVGPRPITRLELSEHYRPDAMEVLSLKPGLTGLWQIRGRSRLSYRRRKRLDLFLVRHFSAGLYFRVAVLTIPELLFGRDAW